VCSVGGCPKNGVCRSGKKGTRIVYENGVEGGEGSFRKLGILGNKWGGKGKNWERRNVRISGKGATQIRKSQRDVVLARCGNDRKILNPLGTTMRWTTKKGIAGMKKRRIQYPKRMDTGAVRHMLSNTETTMRK